MQFEGAVYRPPIEANTFLLQVAVGCSHNKCSFCNMYKDEQFRRIKLSTVEENLKEAKKFYHKLERIFLVGGDAFALSATKLKEVASLIHLYFPECKTITMYAAVNNIINKSDEDLSTLREMGINDLYVGLETGSDYALSYVNKGHTTQQAQEQLKRLNNANIRHNALLITGLAGQGRGIESALATASLLNETEPQIIISTTLGVFDNTKLKTEVESGLFIEATESENLEEQLTLIKNLDLPSTYYWGHHPLNSTPIAGVLGEDQNQMVATLANKISSMNDQEFKNSFKRSTL